MILTLFPELATEERTEVAKNGGSTKSKRLFITLTMTLGLLVSVPVFAHHGNASFATDKTVVLKGTVTKWLYASPHILLMLDVKGEDGEVAHWVLESQSPTVMYPSGYRKDSFKPGDEVTVTASEGKNGKPIGRLIDGTTANGTKLGRAPGPGQGQQ
jgi:hypothetical protein